MGITKAIPAEEFFKKLGMEVPERKEGDFKVVLSPEVVAQFGLNPDDFKWIDMNEENDDAQNSIWNF